MSLRLWASSRRRLLWNETCDAGRRFILGEWLIQFVISGNYWFYYWHGALHVTENEELLNSYNCDRRGGPSSGDTLSVIVWNSLKAGEYGGVGRQGRAGLHRHKHFQGLHVFPSVTHLQERKQQSASHTIPQSSVHPLIKSLHFGKRKKEPFPIKGTSLLLSPFPKKIWVNVFQNSPTQITSSVVTETVWSCCSAEF